MLPIGANFHILLIEKDTAELSDTNKTLANITFERG